MLGRGWVRSKRGGAMFSASVGTTVGICGESECSSQRGYSASIMCVVCSGCIADRLSNVDRAIILGQARGRYDVRRYATFERSGLSATQPQ